MESLLAVAVEATGIIDAELIAVTRTLITGTLVNVDALVATPTEAHLAADLLRVGQQRILAHRLPELGLIHALVVSLGVDADFSDSAGGLHKALVNVCGDSIYDLSLKIKREII